MLFKSLLMAATLMTALPARAQEAEPVARDVPVDASPAAPEEGQPARPPLTLDLDAKKPWGIAIHGGAGVITRAKMTPEKEAAIRDALKMALDAGSAVLAGGGSSVDAVEAAVVVLEDDPNFNAGRGAVLTHDGTISLDAAIMDGRTRAAGAIAATTIAKNPVRAARKVMSDSGHVLLSGSGGDAFVKEMGLETADQNWFETPERRKQLDDLLKNKLSSFAVDQKYGTVGAVALDSEGHVAAATSTGGLTGKRWGRIGDAPLIGAGTYADDRACAVSATGAGEYFIRVGVAHEICARVRMKGEKIVPAARDVLAEVKELGGDGGVILLAPDGQMGWSFNTPGMYRAARDSTGREKVAIYGDE
jgi:beta-aspartyl-peptidase (threonine type)